MRRRTFLTLACLLLTRPAVAGDLGTYGETFDILEVDLLKLLGGKLKAAETSGRIEALNREFASKTRQRVENPTPVPGVRLTASPKTWLYDPSIVVANDIADQKGRVFARRGERINPLERLPAYDKVLIFIDGRDARSVSFAVREASARGAVKTVLILTNGAPLQLAKRNALTFYFDQEGLLTGKFGITQVPAVVTREGLMLRVREVRP